MFTYSKLLVIFSLCIFLHKGLFHTMEYLPRMYPILPSFLVIYIHICVLYILLIRSTRDKSSLNWKNTPKNMRFACILHISIFLENPSRGQKSVMIFFEKFRLKYLEISRFFFNFAVQIKLSLIWKSLWIPTNSPTYFSHAWFLNT